EKEVLQVKTKEEESWMTPIHKYLRSGLLPEDSKESRKIRIKAPHYKMIRGSLYKKYFYTSWLRCIAPPKTDDLRSHNLDSQKYVAKDDRGRTKEVTKRKEGKEVASIEEAYYQNEMCKYHNKRSNHSTYKVGDFVLLLQNNTENPQVWQGPHMIREVHEGELYQIIDASDHSESHCFDYPKKYSKLSVHTQDDVNLSTLLMKQTYP
ncbi:hypothetical protein Tco_1076954, partial [Tanacetum coccineum]